MRRQQCPWCKETTDEASAGWEWAVETGRCPSCRRFFDPANEAKAEEAVAKASHDPKLRADIRKAKIAAAFGGPSFVLLAVVALVVHLPFSHYVAGAAVALGASLVGFALKHDVRAELRGPLGPIRGPNTTGAALRRGLLAFLFMAAVLVLAYVLLRRAGLDFDFPNAGR